MNDANHSFQAQRIEMIRHQLERRDIQDPHVLEAMATVPRHAFVSTHEIAHAYQDRALGIDCGQTISQPYIVALMTEQLRVSRGHRILEIGGGSGYQAAVFAALGCEVYSIERHGILADQAQQRLHALGIHGVKIRHADGQGGWPEYAPYDGILIAAATTDVPAALLAQLRDRGHLVAPIGPRTGHQELIRITKHADGVTRRRVCSVRFVPLLSETTPTDATIRGS